MNIKKKEVSNSVTQYPWFLFLMYSLRERLITQRERKDMPLSCHGSLGTFSGRHVEVNLQSGSLLAHGPARQSGRGGVRFQGKGAALE